MRRYRVAFVAISHKSISDLASDFYEHFDGILSERAGQISVSVYAEAENGVVASHAVIGPLESMGFCLVRTDPDIVDGTEIANRLGVSRQLVNMWAQGTRGSGFPQPISSPGGKRLWTWGQITEWADQNDRLKEPLSLALDEAAQVDAFLAGRRQMALGKPTVEIGWILKGVGGSKQSTARVGLGDDYTMGSIHISSDWQRA